MCYNHRSHGPRVSHSPRRHPQVGIFAGENETTDISPELAVDKSPHPTSPPDLLSAGERHRYCPRSQTGAFRFIFFLPWLPSSESFTTQRGFHPEAEPLHHRDISSPKRQNENQSRRSEHREPLSPESKPTVTAGEASHPGVKTNREYISPV
ncbi:Uncharacterized protein Rs2_10856 [Raphanus sativus]|nr:Uncharacterized protein Rs2_10856 [Raphanus sativus]